MMTRPTRSPSSEELYAPLWRWRSLPTGKLGDLTRGERHGRILVEYNSLGVDIERQLRSHTDNQDCRAFSERLADALFEISVRICGCQ